MRITVKQLRRIIKECVEQTEQKRINEIFGWGEPKMTNGIPNEKQLKKVIGDAPYIKMDDKMNGAQYVLTREKGDHDEDNPAYTAVLWLDDTKTWRAAPGVSYNEDGSNWKPGRGGQKATGSSSEFEAPAAAARMKLQAQKDEKERWSWDKDAEDGYARGAGFDNAQYWAEAWWNDKTSREPTRAILKKYPPRRG